MDRDLYVLVSGFLTSSRIQVKDNQAGFGAGLFLYYDSVAIIQESSIENNTADEAGGGILIYYNSVLTLTNSTVNSNSAPYVGGILNDASQVYLYNSTISGNTADEESAYAQVNTDAQGMFEHSTIVSNTAVITNTGLAIYSGTLTITNSIIANNGTNCDFPGGGVLVSGGYNLDDGTSCGLSGTGDLTYTDPLMQPIADNGGSTLTHAPSSESPVRDVIPMGICTAATDQRGFLRPFGTGCDIGSVEYGFSVYLPIILK